MDGNPRDRRTPVRSGESVAHYEVLGELGRGGMGIVYRARDRNLGRIVALKCPWPDLAEEPLHRKRFLREIRITSSLSHPHIVPLLEMFEHEGLPWVAMQYVEGRTLEQRLTAEGRLPVSAILTYGESLAAALEHAHGKQILHRDVNPRNILINENGDPLLTDFGLARYLDGIEPGSRASTQPTPLTETGVAPGTRPYMSPEQLLGQGADPRSDLFSMGAVLYEMCTGERAFRGTNDHEITDAIVHRHPEAIGRFTYEVPPDLERIIRKSLNKNPAERYQSASELRVDLAALRRETEFRDYSESHPDLIPGLPKVRRLRYLVLGAVGVMTVTMTFLGIWWTRREPEIPVGSPIQVTSTDAWESEPALCPDGQHVVFVSDESGDREIHVSNVKGGFSLRLTHDPANDEHPCWFPDGRDILFVSNRSGEPALWRVAELGGPVSLFLADARDPAISPDGTRVAFARANEHGELRISISPLADPGKAVELAPGTERGWDQRDPCWSPDGKSICFSSGEHLWVVPSTGGEPTQLTQGNWDESPVWSPTGKYIYYTSHGEQGRAIWRIRPAGGDPQRFTRGGSSEVHPTLSPAGNLLAYSTFIENLGLVLLDRRTHKEVDLPGLRSEFMPALSPAGDRVVFLSDRRGGTHQLWVQGLRDGRPLGTPEILIEAPGVTSHPVISPDGAWIAYYLVNQVDEGEGKGTRRDIWVVSSAGGTPVRLTSHDADDFHPSWSPDGSRIAFASQRSGPVRIWVVGFQDGQAHGEPQQVSKADGSHAAPTWSRDGTRIAYVRFAGNASDVWSHDLTAEESDRALTVGWHAVRVRTDFDGDLLVSGIWEDDRTCLRKISWETGELRPLADDVVFGVGTAWGHFDVTPDGRYLVFMKQSVVGDVWVVEAAPRSF